MTYCECGEESYYQVDGVNLCLTHFQRWTQVIGRLHAEQLLATRIPLRYRLALSISEWWHGLLIRLGLRQYWWEEDD